MFRDLKINRQFKWSLLILPAEIHLFLSFNVVVTTIIIEE